MKQALNVAHVRDPAGAPRDALAVDAEGYGDHAGTAPVGHMQGAGQGHKHAPPHHRADAKQPHLDRKRGSDALV